jgi:serine/threonine-protein kinase RsbT
MQRESSAVWKRSVKRTISREYVMCEESFPVEGGLYDCAGEVSTRVKALLKEMRLTEEVVRRAAIVTYEAEMNVCAYAHRGRIDLRVTPERITIEVTDEGQGIPDVKMAMQEGFSTATEEIWHMGFGAGMGLSNIKRYSDFFHISSEVGKGTYLRMMIRINRDQDGATAGSS